MSDEAFYELDLRTADDEAARIDNVWVKFFNPTRPTADIANFQGLTFPPIERMTIPERGLGIPLICEINADLFRLMRTEIFMLNNAQVEQQRARLVRLPADWKAHFDKWNALGNEFDPLKRVLTDSQNIQVNDGAVLVSMTDNAYNNISDALGILAKACLLNLYFKMSREKEPIANIATWFSFVRKILVIGRERFIAVVDDRMGELVEQISENADFEHYRFADVALHHGNIPRGYTVDFSSMHSIKSDESKGNLQLTTSEANAPDGQNVTLLDADIDENGELLPHTADLILHNFNGGTHPYDIHEYLELEYANSPLGYSLVQA